MRDRKLYRSTHRTFKEYCKDRFGFERRHPYRLIEAAGVVDNLRKMCPNWTQNEIETEAVRVNSEQVQILPTTEGQVRPLTKLEPPVQCEVWQQAVEEVGGKVPSGRVVDWLLQGLGKQTKPYLSSLQSKLLLAVEREYKIVWKQQR